MARQGGGQRRRSNAGSGRGGQGASGGRERRGEGNGRERQGRASSRNGSRRNYTQDTDRAKGRPAGLPARGAAARLGASHRPLGEFIEGRRAAAEALRTGFPVKRALVAEASGRRDAALAQLVDQLRSARIPVEYVAPEQLDALSSHGAHQGIALEVGAFPYADLADVVARAGDGSALVVVLDHVTDAGNFGAIVRSAEVVGAAGVVIANKRAAEVNVGAYKTSAGAVMHLPIARVPNIARALEDLKAAGFWVIGASEHAEGSCWDTPLTGRIALVMGSEGEGISRLVLDTCDDLTKLPQRGQTESLNVAQATTALCYEWLRQNIATLDASASADAPAAGVPALTGTLSADSPAPMGTPATPGASAPTGTPAQMGVPAPTSASATDSPTPTGGNYALTAISKPLSAQNAPLDNTGTSKAAAHETAAHETAARKAAAHEGIRSHGAAHKGIQAGGLHE